MSFLFSSSIALVQFLKIVQLELPFFLVSGFLLLISPWFGQLSTCCSQLLIFFIWNKLDHFIFPPKTLPYHYLCYKVQNLSHRTLCLLWPRCNSFLYPSFPPFSTVWSQARWPSPRSLNTRHAFGTLRPDAPPHLLLSAIFHPSSGAGSNVSPPGLFLTPSGKSLSSFLLPKDSSSHSGYIRAHTSVVTEFGLRLLHYTVVLIWASIPNIINLQ